MSGLARVWDGPMGIGGGPSTSAPSATDYIIDLSTRALTYKDLTFTRGGTATKVWLQDSATTIAAVSTGASDALFADHGTGEGGGVWSLPLYTNHAPNAFDLSTGGGWSSNGSLTVTTSDGSSLYASPTGANDAQRVRDTSASTTANNYFALANGTFTQSLWVRTWPGDAPTVPPSFIGNFVGANFAFSPTSTIARYGDTGTSQYAGIFPAAADSSGLVGVGSLATWGFSAIAGALDLPLIDGTKTASAEITFSATARSKIVNAAGDFAIQISCIPSASTWDQYGNSYLFYASSADGELSLRYDAATLGLILRVRGVDVGSTGSSISAGAHMQYGQRSPSPTDVWTQGQAWTALVWYRPSKGDGGIRITVNGCTTADLLITPTGSALAAPTVAYLGSNNGASSFAARWRHEIRMPVSVLPTTPEIVVLADSIVANDVESGICFPGAPTYYYTAAQAATRAGIGCLAHHGDLIANQKAAFLASPWSSQSTVKAQDA